MKKMALVIASVLLACASAIAGQEAVVAPPETLVVEGVPKIPASLAETAGRYGAYRNAALVDWHPTKRTLLVNTRFAETPQLHLVSLPGGERHQLTFFQDAVRVGRFHPNGGDYIVFSKDISGGEWYQLYRLDLATGEITLLTDGNRGTAWGRGRTRATRSRTHRRGARARTQIYG